MKKITSIFFIILIAAVLGGALSYVQAAYIDPSGTPPTQNTPAPILTTDVTAWGDNKYGAFIKIGKIGLTNDKNSNPVDTNQFSKSTMVVMGQTTAESFTSAYSNRIRGELTSSSQLFPLFVGDPTSSTLLQKNADNTPINFIVKDHTRAPRIVIGSATASPATYNLYVEPGSKATNLGRSETASTYTNGPGGADYYIRNRTPFCTLTEVKLASSGCPNGTYLSQIFPDPNPGSGSTGDQVAVCSDYITSGTYYPYSTYFNKGACK